MKRIYCFLLLLPFVFNAGAQSEYISSLPLEKLDILDDEVSAYQVFFTGENHYYTSENNNIKLKMLKYLNKKAGVRNLILELGYSRGFMLDKYINNDSSYYELMRYTTSIYYLEMYKELRKLNQSLDSGNRITVHGIDVERFADDGPILLAKLLPVKKEVPASISFSVEVIRSYGAYSMKKYKSVTDDADEKSSLNIDDYYTQSGFFDAKTIDTMIADYERSKAVYMEYLGADFAVFDKVFKSMEEYRKYSEYRNMPHQYVYRERKIYDNLTALMTLNPDQKYYGQFGRCHVSQTQLNQECNWWAFSSVAKRLNEGSAQDKVMSIGIFYNEKKMNKFYTETYFDDAATTEELKKYIDGECSNSNILKRIDRKDTGLVKHYQYLIYSNSCETKGKKSMYRPSSNDFHEWAKMLDFGAGVAQYDLKNLNGILLPASNGFKQQITFYSFGISNNNFGFYTNSNYRFLAKQKVVSGPVNYTLGGFSITQSLGYMPSIGKRLAFGVYGSLGYNSLRLGVQNDSTSVPFSSGFSRVNSVKYINNAFVVGGGLDIRYALSSWFGLYVRGNYLLDVSNKSWKYAVGSNNIRDNNSPKTSAGYYGINAGISLLIQE
jgi:hypothetical protein